MPYILVDNPDDWDQAINPGEGEADYRERSVFISKQKYDEIKYMNGFYNHPWHRTYNNNQKPSEDSVDEFNINWDLRDSDHFVCSTYSRDLWHTYTGNWFTDLNGYHSPEQIYHALN